MKSLSLRTAGLLFSAVSPLVGFLYGILFHLSYTGLYNAGALVWTVLSLMLVSGLVVLNVGCLLYSLQD